MDFANLTIKSGLRLIAAIANGLAGDHPERGLDDYLRKQQPKRNRDALALVAQTEYRWRRQRDRIMPSELLGEPAWDIILDLYAHEVRGKPISITSACTAACVPPTTALRYIEQMIRAGLLKREPDPLDQRRAYLKLTERGREGTETYLTAQLEASDRPSGWFFVDDRQVQTSYHGAELDDPTALSRTDPA